MASKIKKADFLVRGSTGKRLDQFINEHMAAHGDHLSLAAAIGIATGTAISLDTRTAKAWAYQAERGTLI